MFFRGQISKNARFLELGHVPDRIGYWWGMGSAFSMWLIAES
jgi:hypothetical protein